MTRRGRKTSGNQPNSNMNKGQKMAAEPQPLNGQPTGQSQTVSSHTNMNSNNNGHQIHMQLPQNQPILEMQSMHQNQGVQHMQHMQGPQCVNNAPPPQYLQQYNTEGQSTGYVNSNGQNNNSQAQITPSQMNGNMMFFMQQMQEINNRVLSRLTAIESNVSTLPAIQQNISVLMTDVVKLKTENKTMSVKINDVEQSCQNISDLFDDFAESKTQTETELKQLKRRNEQLEDEIKRSSSNLDTISEELLDLKCRSMIENLLFFGIPEENHPQQEDSENIIREFIKSQVLTENQVAADDIVFDRVHRLGAKVPGKTRPIVAKFEKFTDREKIRKAGIELNKKRNGYSVKEQFPYEIEQRRKQLYPIMRQYKQNPENRVVLRRDKLYINGRQYTEQNDDSERNRRINIPNQMNYSNDVRPRQEGRRFVQANRPTGNQNKPQMTYTQAGDRTPLRTDNARYKNKERSPLEEQSVKKPKQTDTETHSNADVAVATADGDASVAMAVDPSQSENENNDNQQQASGI